MMLRATQLGLSAGDLEMINFGLLSDMFIELEYDDKGYIRNATQKDYDAF